MYRKIASAAILLFWLAMIGSLVFWHILPERRQAKAALMDPDVLASQWWDLEEPHLLKQNGKTVGATLTRISREYREKTAPVEDQIYSLEQALQLNIPIMGWQQEVEARITMLLNHLFHLDSFVATISSGPLQIEAEGFVENQTLYFRIQRPGAGPLEAYLPLQSPLTLLSTIYPVLARHFELKPGASFSVQSFDPLGNFHSGPTIITVLNRETLQTGKREVDVYHLETRMGDMVREQWVTPQGTVIKAQIFGNLIAEHLPTSELVRTFPNLMEFLPLPDIARDTLRSKATRIEAPEGGVNIPLFNILQ